MEAIQLHARDREFSKKLEDLKEVLGDNSKLKDVKVYVFDDFASPTEEKGVSEGDLELDAVVSTPNLDRHGDTINPDGWDLKWYKSQNPVLLWAHKYDVPPIGKAVGLTIEDITKMMKARFKFISGDEFSEKIFRLYVAGFMNSFSVGFRILEFGKRFWQPELEDSYVFDKQELYEVSAVVVPANPEANVIRQLVESAPDEVVRQTLKAYDVKAELQNKVLKGDIPEGDWNFVKNTLQELTKSITVINTTLSELKTARATSSDNSSPQGEGADTSGGEETKKILITSKAKMAEAYRLQSEALKGIKLLIK